MNGSLLGQQKEGKIFIISAPAGTGKTTLVRMLTQEFSQVIASISFTTRKPRAGEVNERDYYFISESEFEEKINASDFLEYVKLYGIHYGTSRRWVENQLKLGKNVCLVIDTQGALELKEKIDAVLIFISPPSLETLKTRLLNRKTETADMVEERLVWALKELKAAPHYDYQIVNDNLADAYQVLRSIIIAECHKTRS